LEVGFITNAADSALMAENPALIARGIYNGILNYFGL
jgi:N-acetylmuramoyl-L-alanine amidase